MEVHAQIVLTIVQNVHLLVLVLNVDKTINLIQINVNLAEIYLVIIALLVTVIYLHVPNAVMNIT